MAKSLLEALKERNQDKEKLLEDKNNLLGFLKRRDAELKSEMQRQTLLQHLKGRY